MGSLLKVHLFSSLAANAVDDNKAEVNRIAVKRIFHYFEEKRKRKIERNVKKKKKKFFFIVKHFFTERHMCNDNGAEKGDKKSSKC